MKQRYMCTLVLAISMYKPLSVHVPMQAERPLFQMPTKAGKNLVRSFTLKNVFTASTPVAGKESCASTVVSTRLAAPIRAACA